jgi:wyosine [tRNA(Phe)-imidazoG37] synthetase (radical SAM superfamily)
LSSSRFEFGSCHAPDRAGPITFGPIPSRRLGRSLGINNIPPKVCSYSSLHCQVGPTTDRTIEPRVFYSPDRLARDVSERVSRAREAAEPIDHLTFVPDGEPTLDANLGETIHRLRSIGLKIAVISNGSLLARAEVRESIRGADFVSVKVDSAEESVWRRVNRPHPDLRPASVQEGIAHFAREFDGRLCTETMLIEGVNDDARSLDLVGDFLAELGPSESYVAIPTRPTPYPGVRAPGEETVNRAYQQLAERVPHVEYLIGYEGDEFAATGDPRNDLLAITAVHPMRESAVRDMLSRAGASWQIVEDLIGDGLLQQVVYRDHRFFVRRFVP